jgi:hypothetical protein
MNETININNKDNVDIPDTMFKEWQSIVDLISRIAKVYATLIMKVQSGEIEVF